MESRHDDLREVFGTRRLARLDRRRMAAAMTDTGFKGFLGYHIFSGNSPYPKVQLMAWHNAQRREADERERKAKAEKADDRAE